MSLDEAREARRARSRDRLRDEVTGAREAAERFRQRWHEALEDGERFRQEARDLRAERDRLRDRADNRTAERDEAWALLKAEIPRLYGRESAEDLPHDSEYVTALHDVLDAMRRIENGSPLAEPATADTADRDVARAAVRRVVSEILDRDGITEVNESGES